MGCTILALLGAFCVGGAICACGQILLDYFRFSPVNMLISLVIAGAVLSGLGLYSALEDFGGAGADIPITNFGNVLVQGALKRCHEDGFLGIFAGVFVPVSTGLSVVIISGFLTALLFSNSLRKE